MLRSCGLGLIAAILVGGTFCCSVPAATVETQTGGFPGKGDYQKWMQANEAYNQATRFRMSGEYDAAIAKYKEAISTYKYQAEFYTNLGLCYKNTGDLKAAESAYKKSLSIKPSWQAYADMGNVLKRQRKNSDARKAFQKALECNPPPELVPTIEQDMALVGPSSPHKRRRVL